MITLLFFSFPHARASVREAEEENKIVAIQNWKKKYPPTDTIWIEWKCVWSAQNESYDLFIYYLYSYFFFTLFLHQIRTCCSSRLCLLSHKTDLCTRACFLVREGAKKSKMPNNLNATWSERQGEREGENVRLFYYNWNCLACFEWYSKAHQSLTHAPESRSRGKRKKSRDIDPNFMDLHNMPVE